VSSIPSRTSLASAAVVLFGGHGAVTALARQRGVCRQTVYRQAHAVVLAVDGTHADQRLQPLRQRVADLEARAAALQQQLHNAVVVDADKQAEFVATAQALGVSLSAARTLLGVVLGDAAPSVSTLGRLTQQAARQAGAVLQVVDGHTRAGARQVAADEIFAGRRPVLMTVEQDSLCWLGGRLAADRDGRQWAQEFGQFPALEQVTRDGGQGLRHGLELVNRQRRAAGQAAVADQDDHFHLLHRARRALREVRAKATTALRRADQTQRALLRARRQGRSTGGLGRAAHDRWQQAEQAFDRWAAQEDAFGRLRAALRLFTPDGALNTRARAQADVHAALADLTGPEWVRARRRLVVPETFTFLDRVHEQLAAVPLPAAVKDKLARAEGLRRRPDLLRRDGPKAAALRGVVLAAAGLVAGLGEAGRQGLGQVRAVLRGAWRASSLVEGLNSVLRMQQARQKRLTQGLLDLKRLHWNTHSFRAGKRKGQSPYQRLGLVLPDGSWWSLLKMTPEQLRQQLSELNPAA
jgi:hypothetical protein